LTYRKLGPQRLGYFGVNHRRILIRRNACRRYLAKYQRHFDFINFSDE
jgi:hypothetical protein